MKSRKPKTSGTEWLYHSMAAFNGSGYADKDSPESYVASYRAYKLWRKESEAISLIDHNKETAIYFACTLVEARDAGHTPSPKNQEKFRKFYNPNNIELFG